MMRFMSCLVREMLSVWISQIRNEPPGPMISISSCLILRLRARSNWRSIVSFLMLDLRAAAMMDRSASLVTGSGPPTPQALRMAAQYLLVFCPLAWSLAAFVWAMFCHFEWPANRCWHASTRMGARKDRRTMTRSMSRTVCPSIRWSCVKQERKQMAAADSLNPHQLQAWTDWRSCPIVSRCRSLVWGHFREQDSACCGTMDAEALTMTATMTPTMKVTPNPTTASPWKGTTTWISVVMQRWAFRWTARRILKAFLSSTRSAFGTTSTRRDTCSKKNSITPYLRTDWVKWVVHCLIRLKVTIWIPIFIALFWILDQEKVPLREGNGTRVDSSWSDRLCPQTIRLLSSRRFGDTWTDSPITIQPGVRGWCLQELLKCWRRGNEWNGRWNDWKWRQGAIRGGKDGLWSICPRLLVRDRSR